MRPLHRFAASMLALAAMACALPISAAQRSAAQRSAAQRSAAQLPAQQPQQPVSHALPAADLLDINTATPEQLNALPGFGPAYTRPTPGVSSRAARTQQKTSS